MENRRCPSRRAKAPRPMVTLREWVCSLLGVVLAAGCASRAPQQQTVGLIPPAERAADLRDDRIRRLGEDRAPAVALDEPLYQIPVLAIRAGGDYTIVEPTV